MVQSCREGKGSVVRGEGEVGEKRKRAGFRKRGGGTGVVN